MNNINLSIERIDRTFRDELQRNREELSKNFRDSREEQNLSFNTFSDSLRNLINEILLSQGNQFDKFTINLSNLNKSNETKLTEINEFISAKLYQLLNDFNANSKTNKEDLNSSIKTFENELKTHFVAHNEALQNNSDTLKKSITELNTQNETKLDKIREQIDIKLQDIQKDNSEKLEQMRATVDEKLQKSLDQKLGESFKLVSDRLEQVHKGLGEMQNLATGVGDLKRVLSNVKSKGIIGEYMLNNLLEQVLTPEQYVKNYKPKKNSNEIVEFAVKLPGKEEKSNLYLPIDSKFPTEDYNSLVVAYENSDLPGIELSKKALFNKIKTFAKDIRDKYINPPETTDFAIMFLPIEGLYAEVLRYENIVEFLQVEYKVIITGPTTLSALLTSLNIGFKTLAIEKRSAEVWKLLEATKSQFGKFGEVLAQTQKNIDAASKSISGAFHRTKQIERKLQNVSDMPYEEADNLLGELNNED
jgi:DNA recombination protein RmuC